MDIRVAYDGLAEKLVRGESCRKGVSDCSVETSDSFESDLWVEEYIVPLFSDWAAMITASERGMRFMIAVAWITEATRMASYIQSLCVKIFPA